MKVIKINKDFCLKEERREIERNTDMVFFHLYTVYISGRPFDYNSEFNNLRYPLQIEKRISPVLWEHMKDKPQEDILEMIFNSIKKHLTELKKIEEIEVYEERRVVLADYIAKAGDFSDLEFMQKKEIPFYIAQDILGYLQSFEINPEELSFEEIS